MSFIARALPKFLRSKNPERLPNGTVLIGSKKFQRIAALKSDGTLYIVKEAGFDPKFRKERVSLEDAGVLPRADQLTEVPASYDEIAAHYERSDAASVDGQVPEGRIAETRAMVSELLKEAVTWRATDIRLIVRLNHTSVIMRIMGEEIAQTQWSREEGNTVVAFFFNARADLSGQTSDEKESVQSFGIAPDPRKIDLPPEIEKIRAEMGPCEAGRGMTGKRLVLRLFYAPSESNLETNTLEQLGHDAGTLHKLKRASLASTGAIIVGGRTGSGKNTTLMRWLQAAYDNHAKRVSVMTVEDPVEIMLHGENIVQVAIPSAGTSDKREEAYTATLGSALRSAPDILMVSEIRYCEAAHAVLEFVNTGHMCASTLHASDPIALVARLIEFGINPSMLSKSGTLRLLLVQSMIQKLCLKCANEVSRDDILKDLPELTPLRFKTLRTRNEAGCKICNPTGMRVMAGIERACAVSEGLEPDRQFLDLIGKEELNRAEEYWLKSTKEGGLGGRQVQTKIIDLMLKGEIDPFHAIRRDILDVVREYKPLLRSEHE